MEHQRPTPEIKIVEIMPCLADPEKIRFIVHIEKDISSVFSYLNGVLKAAIYNSVRTFCSLNLQKKEKSFSDFWRLRAMMLRAYLRRTK